jgi:cytochrome c biogenesis protein CcmG/thiol:disulfide interchange protein DsbE
MSHWRYVPFIIFVGLAVFLGRGLFLNPTALPSAKIGQPIPVFELPDLIHDQTIHSATLRGNVALINVFASWCPSCEDEHSFLMNLSKQGIVLYGLNYKDNAADARSWLQAHGNPYQWVASDTMGKVAMDFGVYGAPETYLINQQGVIQYRFVGELTPEVWAHEFLPRMAALNQKGVS